MSNQENQAARFARDMAANAEKFFKATQLIANTRDEDVNIGTTPKKDAASYEIRLKPAASISAWSTRTSSACGLHEYVSSVAEVAINFGSPPNAREVSSGRKEFLSLNFLN